LQGRDSGVGQRDQLEPSGLGEEAASMVGYSATAVRPNGL